MGKTITGKALDGETEITIDLVEDDFLKGLINKFPDKQQTPSVDYGNIEEDEYNIIHETLSSAVADNYNEDSVTKYVQDKVEKLLPLAWEKIKGDQLMLKQLSKILKNKIKNTNE